MDVTVSTDEGKLDFLPSNPNVGIDEILNLCNEDAQTDVDHNEIKTRADESLQKTVKALIKPLLPSNEWKIRFGSLSEYNSSETAPAVAGEGETNEA